MNVAMASLTGDVFFSLASRASLKTGCGKAVVVSEAVVQGGGHGGAWRWRLAPLPPKLT